MIDSDDLFDLADHLARREVGRPKHVSLRRAISTAYYGVFHAIAKLCADELVGWSKAWEAYTPIYRTLDHSAARRLFVSGRIETIYGEEIAELGRLFIMLQQARYTADYDPSPRPFPISRQEALELIARARQAVRAIREISAEKRERRLLLAVHLIARQR
jgi:uncharacterized protein (UPF0332 family)